MRVSGRHHKTAIVKLNLAESLKHQTLKALALGLDTTGFYSPSFERESANYYLSNRTTGGPNKARDAVNRQLFSLRSFFISQDALRAARVENSVEYLCRRRRRRIFLHRNHKW